MIKKDECFELGWITKTHGLKGEVTAHLDVDFPEDYDELEEVLIEQKGELHTFQIERIRINVDKAIIKFKGINKIEDVQYLVKSMLYLTEDELDELEENQFYYHEIYGYNVVDENKGTLGIVKTVYTRKEQDLVAMDYKGHEILIPVSDEHVIKADKEKKELYVKLPEGLLEVYLDPKSNNDLAG